MEWVLGGLALYLAYDIFLKDKETLATEQTPTFLTKGFEGERFDGTLRGWMRITELQIYADEQGQPIVETTPTSRGVDNMMPLEDVCDQICDISFPSDKPMIVSLCFHTMSTVVLDKVAELFKKKCMAYLQEGRIDPSQPIAPNTLFLVSGGIQGTKLDTLLAFSWSEDNCRRVRPIQVQTESDTEEIRRFSEKNICMMVGDPTGAPTSDVGQWVIY